MTAIAAIHQTDVKALAKLNGITNPDVLLTGQRLWIPSDQPACLAQGGSTRVMAKGIPYVQWKGGDRTSNLVWPIAGRPVLTSGFGQRWGRMHRGIDLSAPIGTPVLGACSGEVVHIGKNGAGPGRTYGNYVVIHHGGGLYTLYAHLHKVLVDKGQKVKGGQAVGEVGSTGRSTGPHLHFEVIEGVTEVDPLPYLPSV